ncbi:glycosyltransferase 87 family protein [Candidatus Villigracilis saccharophilus]|uniref:glycosyltransferase 87 family protein n=1 Tax=Candidatus Villigracilis saccharophilus TaxID=3140684 RepID=UPI003134E25B|nr:DUF2029 domain-containing protein [Anaerolineales bacterium]
MKTNYKKILYTSFALTCLLIIFWFILYTIKQSEFWDFNVFYSSARVALRGENIYHTYGVDKFPYWYFPWVSWFFIPLAFFSFGTAKIIYTCLTFASIIFIIYSTSRHFQISFASQMLIAAMAMLMCWLLFRAGQMDFILTAIIVAAIFLIDKKQNFQAGLLFPIFLFKPHLLIIFIPFAILRGGQSFLLSAFLSVFVLSLIAFIRIPNWPYEMIRMLNASGLRTDNLWGFTTLSELIGREENWSGTANLPITIVLLFLTTIIVWKNRHLPTAPFLVLTLSASMLCAPRAYSYNFPFLIPALIWVTSKKTIPTVLMWLSVGVISFATKFSTEAYLIVIATFILSTIKSINTAKP